MLSLLLHKLLDPFGLADKIIGELTIGSCIKIGPNENESQIPAKFVSNKVIVYSPDDKLNQKQ